MRISVAIAAMSLWLLPASAPAQERETTPSGAKFIVQLDLDAFRASRVGSQLFEAATQAAMNELGDDEEKLDQVREALGFDPLTEIHGFTLFGSDFDSPEDDLQVVIRMGKTTGNLEGMVLALPEYESSDYGDHIIHSAQPDDDMQVFAVIYEDNDGNHSVVAATRRAAVEKMLDTMSEEISVAPQLAPGAFLSVNILELPMDQIGDGPQENIAKLLRQISLTVSEADENFAIHLSLSTEDEQKAEQLRQMAQGVVAMIGFVQDEGDDDLKMVQELLRGLTVQRDEATITLDLEIPTEKVIEFLREEADLPL